MGGSTNISNCQVSLKVTLEAYKDMGDVDGIADPVYESTLSFLDTLADGRGANSADLFYVWSGVIPAGSNVDIALEGGADKTPFGDALSFAVIKALLVKNTGATQIRLGDRPADAFEGWVLPAGASKPIGPGGVYLDYRPDATGYPVAAGNILRVHNDSGIAAGAFQILIVGEETDVSSSSASSESSSSQSGSSVSASASSASASSLSASLSSASSESSSSS